MRLNRGDYTYILPILSISIIQFVYFLYQNSGSVYGDEARYYQISKMILENGLFNFADDLRTYLYPLLMSFFYIFTNGDLVLHKLLFSIFQYIVYGYTIWSVALVAYEQSGKKITFYVILVMGLTNPYLIQSTTLFLTDILSACFVVIALIYLLRSDLSKIKNGVLLSLFLYGSVLIRPSSAIFLVLFFIIAIYRYIKLKDIKPFPFVVAGVSSLILFLPQLYMNIKQFDHFTPLIHVSLYKMQSIWAAQFLKYGTVIIADETPQLYYYSPYEVSSDATIFSLFTDDFFVFIFLIIAHIFGMLDWGFVDSYIKNLSASSKLIPTIILNLQWILMVIGIIGLRRRKADLLIWNSLLFIALGYTLFMSTTTVESRFGYPIYLILLYFSGFGVDYVLQAVKSKRKLVKYIIVIIVMLLLMLYLSFLLDSQTGRIFWFNK